MLSTRSPLSDSFTILRVSLSLSLSLSMDRSLARGICETANRFGWMANVGLTATTKPPTKIPQTTVVLISPPPLSSVLRASLLVANAASRTMFSDEVFVATKDGTKIPMFKEVREIFKDHCSKEIFKAMFNELYKMLDPEKPFFAPKK